MVRLDKYLCDCNLGSRTQVKDQVKKGLVMVNGKIEKNADRKIDESKDLVEVAGKICTYRKYAYFMLHKPAGVVSATIDNTADTVLTLLKGVDDKNLFPVGRLDKDTTGLLLITNDGDLSHRLLSPKKHVDKTYMVDIREPLTQEDRQNLEHGVDIGDDKPTLPAKVEILSSTQILLTIQEGRFHQVKRMLQAVKNEVISLKRTSFGPLTLDPDLAPGQFRELTNQELEACMKC